MLKQHIWLLDKCEVPLRISVQHERAVLIGPSKGRSLSSAIGRPFESRRWIGCALADRLSFGHPTAELCYVGSGSSSASLHFFNSSLYRNQIPIKIEVFIPEFT